MLNKKIIFIILTLLPFINYAQQNLVVNPSFEEVNLDNLECSFYQNNQSFINAVNNWSYASLGSSDLYHTSLSTGCVLNPLSTDGFALSNQLPRTGNSMVGIINIQSNQEYREYIQGELTAPLQVGSVYEISFYVLKSWKCSYATNNFGIKFFNAPMYENTFSNINEIPDANYSGTPITETENWVLVSFQFTPTTPGLNYFVIGNFFNDANTTVINFPELLYEYAYYLIDDISIKFIEEIQPPEFDPIGPICEGDSFSLPTTSLNGITGSWSPAINTLETTTYTFTPNNSLYPPSEITVVVIPKTVPSFEVYEAICYNSSNIVLPTTSLNGISGSWYPVINPTQTTTYTFTPSPGQCATQQSLEIIILKDFDFTIDYFCKNDHLYAEVVDTPTLNTTEATIEWGINGVQIPENNKTIDLNTYVTDSKNSLTIEVIVTNKDGCRKKKSMEIATNIPCMIPKGISPNGDGLNDFLDLENFDVDMIKIYNRYGDIVYEKKNYKNEWNGYSNNGNKLSTATYYYHITTKKGENFTGWIYLIHEVQ